MPVSKIFMTALALTMGSCMATLKNGCSSRHASSPEPPSQNSSADEPSILKRVTTTATPPPAETAKIEVNAGAKLLDAPGEKISFVHLINSSTCSGGVDAKIMVLSNSAAVLVRENCLDRGEARTLPAAAFRFLAGDSSALIYNEQIFQREENTASATLETICEGGENSKKQQVAVEIKKKPGDGSLQARLLLPSDKNFESTTFPVAVSLQKQFSNYQAGEPGHRPYFKLSLGNVNGLTAFVSYEFNTVKPGEAAILYHEESLSLPRCLTREQNH